MHKKIIFILLLYVYINIPEIIEKLCLETTKPNTSQLILKYGYPSQVHEITTEDGYILTLNRIPPKNFNSSKIPIIFLHGIQMSSADFVNLGPSVSPIYIFSDNDYDVWLLNCRGTCFSRKHTTLNADSHEAYWNFSFHEIGYYDVPALIHYVLNITKSKYVHVVAFSQGATALCILLAEKPHYNEIILTANFVAPSLYIGNTTHPFLQLLGYFGEAAFFVIGKTEFLPNQGLAARMYAYFCSEIHIFSELCLYVFDFLSGISKENINMDTFHVMISNLPAGASSKQFYHFGQYCYTGQFKMYDYGKENLIIYGQINPPEYNISRITVPINVYYSPSDPFCTKPDIMKTKQNLPHIIIREISNTSHVEFLYGLRSLDLVYRPILESIQKHDIYFKNRK